MYQLCEARLASFGCNLHRETSVVYGLQHWSYFGHKIAPFSREIKYFTKVTACYLHCLKQPARLLKYSDRWWRQAEVRLISLLFSFNRPLNVIPCISLNFWNVIYCWEDLTKSSPFLHQTKKIGQYKSNQRGSLPACIISRKNLLFHEKLIPAKCFRM